jgi:hypothetical protein
MIRHRFFTACLIAILSTAVFPEAGSADRGKHKGKKSGKCHPGKKCKGGHYRLHGDEWWRHLERISSQGRFRIPPGHRPPPGMCRLWLPGVPPGHQPPPQPCSTIRLRPGAYIVYGDYGYDCGYNWPASTEDVRRTVPHIILDIILDQLYRR